MKGYTVTLVYKKIEDSKEILTIVSGFIPSNSSDEAIGKAVKMGNSYGGVILAAAIYCYSHNDTLLFSDSIKEV